MGKKQQIIISKMLSTLSCHLSDRSSVMKEYNTLFNEWRENLLKENIPHMDIYSLFCIYCSAHVLLGFHTSVNSTLKHFTPTQNDESEAVRTIRIACELFGPRGDERNGYAIQVYWGKFPIYHHIVETDLITFLRVL